MIEYGVVTKHERLASTTTGTEIFASTDSASLPHSQSVDWCHTLHQTLTCISPIYALGRIRINEPDWFV